MTSSSTCESTLYFIKKDSRIIIAIKACDFGEGGDKGVPLTGGWQKVYAGSSMLVFWCVSKCKKKHW